MWQALYGHDGIAEQFRSTLEHGRLASTYLFVGPNGVGKRSFARTLAGSLFCSATRSDRLTACGTCENCRLMAAGNHPDFLEIAKPPDRSELPIGLLIGDREHRHREGLCHELALRPYLATRRFAVIDDADDLNTEGANALLKTLEEPPPGAVLVLIGTAESRQLPTIRSRSQIVRFRPLEIVTLVELLHRQGHATSLGDAEHIANHAGGSMARALRLASSDLLSRSSMLIAELTAPQPRFERLHAIVSEGVNAAGSESVEKRNYLLELLDLAIEGLANQLRHTGPATCNSVVERIVDQLDSLVELQQQVPRNVNLPTAILAWAQEVARIGTPHLS